MPSRRHTLRRLGALCSLGVAAVAGCTAPGGAGTDTTDASTTSATTTGPADSVALDPTSFDALGPGATVRVYPANLREWLRRAATTDGVVRAKGASVVPAAEPVLPGLSRATLANAGDADGTYRLTVQGGIHYELLVGAERAEPPADATVDDAAALPEDRRSLVREAVDGDVRVEPQTPRGEFVRTEFFGRFWRVDGAVYRGVEVQQTDAAFFSEAVWYVLAAEAADGDAEVTLDLAEVPQAVHGKLDEAIREYRASTSPGYDGPVDDRLRSFVESTDYVLVHDAVLGLELR